MPNSTWKDKTCEKCVFRVSSECRRFPPGTVCVVTGIDSSDEVTYYPAVDFRTDGFSPACAEYAESLSGATVANG